MHTSTLSCPVCHSTSAWLDVVDFNKSCEEPKGRFLPLSGVPIYYALCPQCGFCFAPAMQRWSPEGFAQQVYNKDYVLVDPDYIEVRPAGNARMLQKMFAPRLERPLRHLDYGGGNGRLAALLQAAGWDSTSYDPFVQRDTVVAELGQFDLITAFEVFEHAPDVQQLMAQLRALRTPDGLVLFSTLVSDGHIRAQQRLGWWYASPRNGHISLFSKNSLAQLTRTHGLHCGSFSDGLHVAYSHVPAWASHILRSS